MKISNLIFLAVAACIAAAVTLTNADANAERDLFYEQMAQIEQEMEEDLLELQRKESRGAKRRVRRANKYKYPYGEGRAGGDEGGKVRLVALENAVPRRQMLGAPTADQLCREAASRAGLDPNIWRAVIANQFRSLNSLLVYETERKKAKVCNREGEVLFGSWAEFLTGGERSASPLLTFNGTNLDDLSIDYAWFGYLQSTKGNEPLGVDAAKPYCGNWMLTDGFGPALDLNGFLASRSVQENIRSIRCNNDAATLLCVEARVPTSTSYSPFGLTKPRRPRIKGFRRRYTGGSGRATTQSPRRPTTRNPRRQ